MDLPEPWIFAFVGTLLVIISAALSGFYTSYLERIESLLQRKIRNIEDDIVWSRERLASGSQRLSGADIKLVLLQSTQPPAEVLSIQLNELANDILRGIVDRNSAATGDHHSEDQMQEWMAIRGRAAEGDSSAFSKLSEISSDLLKGWSNRNNELVEMMNGTKAEIEHMRQKVSQVRLTSVALQILGLAIVLMKDLPR